ncbi:MAG: hypothetical protein AAF772_14085 [Acidobacteriota bacterium]
MSASGVRLNLLIGPTVPIPAPAPLMDALATVEVKHAKGERSGFQIAFRTGKAATMALDLALMELPVLKTGMRVILTVFLGALPKVLIDGLITRTELKPAEGEGGGTQLVLTGEDVSFAMDQEEKNVEHPAQPDTVVALKIIALYARYGLIPMVIPPPSLDVPIVTDRTPTQQGTDLKHLQKMAARYNYVFHVAPGPVPGTNTAYWGPDLRLGVPQAALTVDMGSDTNVESLTFENAAAEVTQVRGTVQDRWTGLKLPVLSLPSLRVPFALSPALLNSGVAKTKAYRALSGRNIVQAVSDASADSEATSDVVKGTGALDTARYGGMLQARGVVGVRGVGLRYDGLYTVHSVTHKLTRNSYKQEFEIVREGTISTVPVVPTRGIA